MTSLYEKGRSYYGNYIVDFRSNCEKSIVLLISHRKGDAEKKVIALETGIIFASGRTSCCIMTSHHDNRDGEECQVQFYDGTRKTVTTTITNLKQFGMDTILLFDVDNPKPVRFSTRELNSCDRIFTCGYNSNQKGRCFFSGSIVSGVGLRDKTIGGRVTLFGHGCSTGARGHHGSAVFDESQYLVGMNVLYARSKGENYVMPKTGGKEDNTDFGGIVSALDLPSINLALASRRGMKGKSIADIVEHMTTLLLSYEADCSQPKAAKDVGTSKAPAGGG